MKTRELISGLTLFLILFFVWALMGCQKEEINCNCGKVVYVDKQSHEVNYEVIVKNDCSGYNWVSMSDTIVPIDTEICYEFQW